MALEVLQQLKELGSKLESLPGSKDTIIKLLKRSEACLAQLDQSPTKSVVDSMQPLVNAVAKPEYLQHQDREVKLFVASCICEITRITAPEAPYDDNVFKDIFQLLVSTFNGLNDISAPSFRRRAVILETMAKYKSCVVMLDLECYDLIKEMFNTFFAVVSDEHPGNVLTSMQTIMEVLLDECEDVPESLLFILLSILGRDKEGVIMAARKLAMNVIGNCAAKLEPGIKQFLVSSMSGDRRPLLPETDYHAVLYDIYLCAPQILPGVVPYLTGELLSDQVEIRMKAVSLVGNLFALPKSTISEAFEPVFSEFLKRLTDRVVDVRMSVLHYVKTCLLENPFRGEAHQIISALCDRLLDYDENVRKQVVAVLCDVAYHSLKSSPSETIKMVSERLRDKSVLVKRYAMERLGDIYRMSWTKHSTDSTRDDEYDWIVGKILRCFYDKDFRSDTIEHILSLSLFPPEFSVKDKVAKWVRLFSGFDKVEVKALEKILEQKRRLQQEMQKYLSLRESSQGGDDTEMRKKVMFCFRVMSRCFGDPAKAEENFQILDELKDAKIWKIFARLIDPNTSALRSSSLRDDLLKVLGQKHRLYEFLGALSLKCSYMLFDKDHVREFLLEARVQKSSGTAELILSCMAILVILARFCPLLFGGTEEDLVHLLEDDNEIIKEGTLHILARAGGTIREKLGVSSRSLDLILERISIEGSRRQAKYAVHALASITKDDGLKSLSVLYKRLVDMLEEKSHLPAVLQSLGCIAQAAMPVFETRESEIQNFIKEHILKQGHVTENKADVCWDDISELCSLKIFGLKALVKSYLPVKDIQLRSGVDDLINIIKNILFFGDISKEIKSSSVDKAHLKLAAAKAILRLSKHWEHKIPVDVLYLTLRTSEDNFPEVKKLFLSKVHQYVRDRILDPKYACAFLLDVPASQADFEENKRCLNDIIQMCRQGRGLKISVQADAMSPSLYPEYILPYVVHSLAHHPSFPDLDECQDVKSYEPMFRKLYLFLSMLLHGDAEGKSDDSISKDKDSIKLLCSIFQSIRHSEDAFDPAKSKNLYALCDLGVPIIKKLASNQDELQDLGAPVPLTPVLFKPLEKKEENNSLESEGKTWLADEGIFSHFESLELEPAEIVHPLVSEDDIMKDSETEGNEMPLGKLMQRLKAKAARTKKEAKTESLRTKKEAKDELAQAGVSNENDFDILKMVKEINSDNAGTSVKLSSNGHENARRKRIQNEPHNSRRLNGESTDIPVPKRKRTSSAQAHKTTVKGSRKPTNVNEEDIGADVDKMNEEPQTNPEDQHIQDKTDENPESEMLFSRIRKKLGSSSKQKGKRVSDSGEAFRVSSEAKKPKKVPSSENSPRSIVDSKLGSMKKQKTKSLGGLGKCTTKENGSSAEDLIDLRIKVWWPMDKKYYEGVVKSYDTEKKKHVILYDDGDVEVLRLDKERWEPVEKDPKRSGSSKGVSQKGGLSGNGKKSSRSPNYIEDLEKSLTSQVRRKRTPRKNPNKKPKIPDIAPPESDPMSHSEDSVSEKEEYKRVKKMVELLNKEEDPAEVDLNEGEDLEETESENLGGSFDEANGSSDNETVVSLLNKLNEGEDLEETESENCGGSFDEANGSSDNEAVSYSDKKPSSENNEEFEGESDRKASSSDTADVEFSDDEPLFSEPNKTMFGFSVRTWQNGFGSPKSVGSPVSVSSPARPVSPGDTNSPKVDVGEIDTRAPFESVKAAVSLFGEVVSPRARPVTKKTKAEEQRLLEKETQHHMILRELDYYKEKLRQTESARAHASRDLQQAHRTVHELTNKLDSLSESKQSAIRAADEARLLAGSLEARRAHLGSDAWKLDVDSERESYRASASQLIAAKQDLTTLRQDVDSALDAKLAAFHEAEEARQLTRANLEKKNRLLLEVFNIRETLDQVRAAARRAEEEHLRLVAEREIYVLVHKSARELGEREIQRLIDERGPTDDDGEKSFEEVNEAVNVLREQLDEVRTGDLRLLRDAVSRLELGKRELEELSEEENSSRANGRALGYEVECVRRKKSEYEEKAREVELRLEARRAELERKKDELREAKKSRGVLEETRAKLDEILRGTEKYRREAEGVREEIERMCREADEANDVAREMGGRVEAAMILSVVQLQE
ncbi:sister chromatid cohesion protein pds5 [Striga asiatica]|uniref:Sister chromatid cohesion protein pds5 n=1 Tax=Striga asiatica TaxID=4170 RepID=A0A5A7PXU6_STRAF|nr:sister chromatid cohesion protein pds5 [Striga asiatica]